jgi:multiple sugar transport system substrate-binding protein
MPVARYHPALLFQGGSSMRKQAVLVALALVLAPVGAKAADLVLWCDEPYYAEEGEAIREIITAFEQGSGKQVELVFHPESEHPKAIVAALKAGQPPDFAFGLLFSDYVGQWALH